MIRDQITATVWRRETMAETAARYREAVRRIETNSTPIPTAVGSAAGLLPLSTPGGGVVAARDHGSEFYP